MAENVNKVNTPVVRICAWCAHEHLIAPNGNETHGICRRHAVAQFVTMGFSASEAESRPTALRGITDSVPTSVNFNCNRPTKAKT
jgi:hypothetical protein